jgi:hypothetical protein
MTEENMTEEEAWPGRGVSQEQGYLNEALMWVLDAKRHLEIDPELSRQSLGMVEKTLRASILRCSVHARALLAIGELATKESHRAPKLAQAAFVQGRDIQACTDVDA